MSSPAAEGGVKTADERITGSLRWGYLAAYLGLQHLFAGGLIAGGIWMAGRGGPVAWVAAGVWWLIGGYWLLAVWRETAGVVSWFRLENDTLIYRTVGSGREQAVPLSAVLDVVIYRAPRHSAASGFTLHTLDRGRLGFDFFWLPGSAELCERLRAHLDPSAVAGPK